MKLNEKLLELRKQKGLTQEELATALFVSRTAISKWESGRGYPNIDSLKALSVFFGVTVDELLSGDQLLTIAQEESKKREEHLCGLVFGLLDCSVAMLFFLPFFGQITDGFLQEVSLLDLTEPAFYLRAAYLAIVIGMNVWGLLNLALQNLRHFFWMKCKNKVSMALNAVGVLLFIIGSQPYSAAFLFLILMIKAIMMIKW